jgi:hypothetical protein
MAPLLTSAALGMKGLQLSSRNTVHFMILRHPEISMRTFKPAARGRSGKLLILRFTPRGLRRHRLETTRSCKISPSTDS